MVIKQLHYFKKCLVSKVSSFLGLFISNKYKDVPDHSVKYWHVFFFVLFYVWEIFKQSKSLAVTLKKLKEFTKKKFNLFT